MNIHRDAAKSLIKKMAKVGFASTNNNLQVLRNLIKYTNCADAQSSAVLLHGPSHLKALPQFFQIN